MVPVQKTLVLFAFGVYFNIDWIDWILIIIMLEVIIISELFHIAIGYLVKMFSDENHELSEILLNISAGAVIFAVASSFIIAIIVLFRNC